MAEGGDQWTPSSERRQTRSATGPSHRDKVDRVWITNRVYIVERKGNQPKYFEFHGDICLIQFLFKHHKDHLTKPNGWEYENHNGVPCIYILYDNSVEKCIDNVKEWISKFQDVEVKKLELSSGNTEDSLQRSLSYLTPECIDGKADVFLDEVHDCLYIVGFHQTVNNIFRKTKAAMKNEEMTKKAEEIVIHLDSKSHGLLLREFGFLDKLGQDFPNDSIHLLDCNTKVIYTGAQNEAEKCRKAIAQFFSGICTETLQMSPVKTELLSNPRVKTYVNEALQANKILCVWEVVSPGLLLLRCPQKKHIEEAHVKIEENIKEEVFSARDYPQLRETPSKRFGLNESQLEKVFVRHTSENTHVAATIDVMDHIMRWMQSTYPDVSGGSEYHWQSAAKESKKLHQRLQVQELDLELWKALSIADACSKVPERRCTIENNCIVIEALERDLTKIVEEIKGILDRVKKDKSTVPLQADCAALLRNKEAKCYVNQELGKNHPRCVWKIGSKCDTVDVYTLPVKEAVNAGKIIGESVSLASLSKEFTDVERLLKENNVVKVLQKYRGKFEILSITDDVGLVGTVDALKDILDVMRASLEDLNTSVSVLLEMTEGIGRFVLERNPKFIKKLQEDFGIKLRPTGIKNQIEIFGQRQNIDFAKSVLEKETGKMQSDYKTMMFLPNCLATKDEKLKFEAVNNCYVSVENEMVAKKPCPSHTWIVSKSPYMMLVPGNITEADVYAVMCPIDRHIKPIGAGKGIMMCAGKSVEQNLHQSHGPSVSKPKSDSCPHISEETGSLRCQSIIYTRFPSQDEKGSRMSTSMSVVASSIRRTLETADANKVFSLAIPLDFCDVMPEATCMQATAECLRNNAGGFSHLKEIYLYCDETEEENARSIFTKVLLHHEKLHSLNFSPLITDVAERKTKSPIQLEILRGSLVDQKVDIIVNTTNTKLNLDNGCVSKTVLAVAGNDIQVECNHSYPHGISIGDIAETNAGKCPYIKHIFHVVLPPWRPTGNFSLMVLELLMTKCLKKADEYHHQSIAFPVLGTGALVYPTQLVVKTMCDTINKYGRNRKTNIKTVKIAVFEPDAFKIFQIYERNESFGVCESGGINPPHSLLEARIPTQFTSIQMQVLPFYGCRWRVHALAEFVTTDTVLQDPQYEDLKSRNHTKEWITKDSEHYLYIRILSDTEDKINKGIKEVLKITAEERISSLGFVVTTLPEPTSKKQLGCKEQAKMIKKKVIEVTEGKEDKTGYLQEIKILVKSAEDFHMFLANKESKKSKESGKMEKLYNNFMGKKKCPWKIVRYVKQADMGFKVTVVASKEVLPEVMKFIRSESVGGYYGNRTYHENQTDARYSGQSTTVGATGGYPGNQTDTRYSGQSTTVGATGGSPGNQTDTRYSGQSTTVGATGGSQGNQTDTRYSGQSTTLGATGGYPGNQMDARYSGQSTTHDAIGGYHGNQSDAKHSLQSTTVGATGGHHGNQNDARDSGQSTTVGATARESGSQLKATMPIKSIQSPHHIQYQQPSMDKQASFQYNDIFDGVEASMNQGLRDVIQREDLLKMQELDKNGQIRCKDLDCLKNIESTLNGKVNSASAREMEVNDQKEHFKRSSDDFEHVSDINIGMSEETFLAIQFFCRGDRLMQQHSFGYHDGMLQINCKDKDEKDNLETSIESKLKHLEVMNKDDVSFTTAEKPKIRGTIDQIHKDVEGVYCYLLKEDEHSVVHVMAQNYSQLQTAKHKILLGIGRIKQTETRRNRRFDNTTPQQGERTLTESKKFSQSYHGSRASWQPPQPTFGYGSVTPTDFTTAEGLLVKVYSGSILHLDVDCIVNAANGDLQHGGGVARVISDAAGYEFDKESRDYIYSHGPLRVGEVCTTSAGNLKYKGVIHAVGPRWYDYSQDQKRDCLCDLKEAVKNSLEEADFQRYKSIAIPAISSGIFGVPKELCALQYFRAVEEYSSKRGRPSTLTEVHFIDKDIQMCQLIQTTFTKCFTGGHEACNEDKHNLSSFVKPSTNTMQKFGRSNSLPLDPDTDGTSVDPDPTDPLRNRRLPTPSGQTFEIGNNLTVRVVHGNIVNINADAIVSPENIQCDSTGRIAREIARVAGNNYVETDQSEIRLSRRKPKLTEVLDTLGGKSNFKYVLHVVAPEWDVAAFEDQSKYWRNLEKSYNNVFSLVDRKRLDITSIALPMLGTGTVADYPTPINSISKLIARICKDYAEKTPTKKTFYICNDDAAVILHLKGMFEKTLSKRNETKDDRRGQEETQRCQDQESNVTEDCCICMDTITDPKRLSCGHVFCRDCIDQQFKYKPVCPQCGAVHGEITGDQPTGTIDIKTIKSSHGRYGLPGYPGYGIISITYTFPSGKQGPEHPTPGKYYQGISRTAYLPDNNKGRLVSKLLNIAFNRKLVFTIGRSRTTGYDGVVTWNDIHHKTRVDGGPQAFGYPDDTYLDRVLDELKAKGVTEESLKDP